jgi:HEAT repeat protein
VAALSRSDPGVSSAAAVALGRVGSSSAVPRLREVESTTPDDALRRLARGAVARIQARLTGATPGQLSLTDGESGRLSLSEDEAGRVSLTDDDAPGSG